MNLFVYDNPDLELKYRLVFLGALLLFWCLPWKGMALWKAAKRGQKAWFIVLFLCNTVGILDILYIYYFSKPKTNQTLLES